MPRQVRTFDAQAYSDSGAFQNIEIQQTQRESKTFSLHPSLGLLKVERFLPCKRRVGNDPRTTSVMGPEII
jgi:hypothetical protein